MKNMKKILVIAAFFACAQSGFSASFSGNAGLRGDFYSAAESDYFDPLITLTGFFEGHFNIRKNLFLRTEMSIHTADIIETKMTEETDATFCVDELSLTYVKQFLGISQFFSIFKGDFESLGTNRFLAQQFGCGNITSFLTESSARNTCASSYSIYGLGASYVARLNPSPVALGAYIYKNNENDADEKQINIDFRLAAALKNVAFDFIAGIGAPVKNKNGDEDVILLIDELYLHTGLDFLIGNKYSTSLFVQSGFNSFGLKKGDSNSSFSTEDFYLLFEPRFCLANSQIHLSVFNFPEEQEAMLEFIEGNLGANLNIFTDQLFVRNVDVTFGFNTSFSYDDRYLSDLKDIKDFYSRGYIVKVCPYLSVPVMSGNLKLMLQTKLSEVNEGGWQQNFKLNLGYKSTF